MNSLKTLYSVLFLLTITSSYAVTKTASQSGNWEASSTWGGTGMPSSGDNVIIANGLTISVTANNYNGSPASLSITLGNSTQNGFLAFSGSSQLNLTSGSLITLFTGSAMSSTGSSSDQLQFGTGSNKEVYKGAQLNFAGPGTFGIDGGISTPLPIEIGTFDVTNNNSATLLNWTTLTEVNNDYFTIERSVDLEIWEAIGEIDGMGNSSTLQTYEYADNNFEVGTVNYYRIKQTDYDGQFSYSEIRSVSIKKQDHVLFPNPCNNQFVIQGSEIVLESVFVSDAQGNNVTNQIEISSLGDTQISVNSSTLPSGMYFVRISNNFYPMVKE